MREFFGGKARWVRAVDGLSFDVRRGEVFCLVGESGCGKTTTGKALLGLVGATEGDIFLEAPSDAFAKYEGALPRAKSDPDAAKLTNSFRRKYSFTWKETTPWTGRQYLTYAAFAAAAFMLGFMVPSLAVGFLSAPYTNSAFTLGTSAGLGLLVGLVGSVRPTRPSRRTPVVLALAALAALLLAPIPTYLAFAYATKGSALGVDLLGTVGSAWGGDAFGLLIACVLAPAMAGGASRAITSTRMQTEGLTGIRMRALRKRLQLIFQDPYESLNPKQSVYEIVSEPLQVNRIVKTPDEASSAVVRALNDAGLRPPEEFMFRFPHELSGGQRQRVSVAAALVLQPDFIVADEPVSMLDVSVRTQILELMTDLRKTRGITYLFITHDLGLAWVLGDRIAVMYLGKIVEIGTSEEVIRHPKHPYTQALISVVPSPDPRHRATRVILKGERPDPSDIPSGCRFHPRCPFAFEKCGWNAQEVAEAFQDAERDIAARIRGAIQERQARIADLRKRAKGSAMEAQALEDQAKALEKEIQDLQPGRTRALELANAIQAAGPHAVNAIAPASMTADELVESLTALVNAQRNTRLPFKGIADIAATSGGITVRLHPWAEPDLVEITPGNSVACYLVSPLPKEEPALEPIL